MGCLSQNKLMAPTSTEASVGEAGHRTKALRMNKIQHKKVSPPFEGGVVGTIDYLIYRNLFPDRGG
jgi:hypothetical protein